MKERPAGVPFVGLPVWAGKGQRRGLVLCNVARGSLIDEEALPAALRAGRPGAAILDVTRGQPDLEHPRRVSLPHSSTFMDGYNDRLLGLFADNLLRYQRGAPLQNLVDRARGY